MIKLVVIGAGLIGYKHARLIQASENCELVAICDVDGSRKQLAADLGVPFFDDPEAMIRTTRPDGAIVATPNNVHLRSAEVCAKHSTHMLIEKPIADTLEAARQIVQLAGEAQIKLLVGHHRRHNPLVQQARTIVRSGELGKLVGVSVLWTVYKPEDYFTVAWRRSKSSGGPGLINLIHELDNLRFICGEIRQVQAMASTATRGFEVEDTLSITLSFENGALGSILLSDTAAAPWSYELTTGENPDFPQVEENCCHFVGTHSSLTFPQMEMWFHSEDQNMGWQSPLKKVREPAPKRRDPLESQLDHFCRVIQGQEEPVVSGPDAAQSLAAVLAVLTAASSGTAVRI